MWPLASQRTSGSKGFEAFHQGSGSFEALQLHEVASLAWGLGSATPKTNPVGAVRTFIRRYVFEMPTLPASADQRALAMLARGLLKLDLQDAFASLLDRTLLAKIDLAPVACLKFLVAFHCLDGSLATHTFSTPPSRVSHKTS